jgi:hypothetical protein
LEGELIVIVGTAPLTGDAEVPALAGPAAPKNIALAALTAARARINVAPVDRLPARSPTALTFRRHG